MKIVFSRQKAAASLAPLMNATTGRSAVSTSDGFLIEASAPDKCVFTAYDLETGKDLPVVDGAVRIKLSKMDYVMIALR